MRERENYANLTSFIEVQLLRLDCQPIKTNYSQHGPITLLSHLQLDAFIIISLIKFSVAFRTHPHTKTVPIRQHENLLRENSRIGRIYRSQQAEQNGKISCLCSDFKTKITKKRSRLPIK